MDSQNWPGLSRGNGNPVRGRGGSKWYKSRWAIAGAAGLVGLGIGSTANNSKAGVEAVPETSATAVVTPSPIHETIFATTTSTVTESVTATTVVTETAVATETVTQSSTGTQSSSEARQTAPQRVVTPEPTTKAPQRDVHYKNCREAKAAGAAPLHRGDPGYSSDLDRDGDGVACER